MDRTVLRRHGRLLHQATDVKRSAGLGTGSGKPPAPERLDSDNGADDVAIYIKVACFDAARHMRDRFIQAGMKTESQPIARPVDVVDQAVEILAAVADHMKNGTEDFLRQVGKRLDLDNGRRNEGAVFGFRRERQLLNLAAERPHLLDMLIDAGFRRGGDNGADVDAQTIGAADRQLL